MRTLLAGLASVADDRTLNTWRNELQVHLLLTTHETSLNMVATGIRKYWKRPVLYGIQEALKTLKEVYYVI